VAIFEKTVKAKWFVVITTSEDLGIYHTGPFIFQFQIRVWPYLKNLDAKIYTQAHLEGTFIIGIGLLSM